MARQQQLVQQNRELEELRRPQEEEYQAQLRVVVARTEGVSNHRLEQLREGQRLADEAHRHASHIERMELLQLRSELQRQSASLREQQRQILEEQERQATRLQEQRFQLPDERLANQTSNDRSTSTFLNLLDSAEPRRRPAPLRETSVSAGCWHSTRGARPSNRRNSMGLPQ